MLLRLSELQPRSSLHLGTSDESKSRRDGSGEEGDGVDRNCPRLLLRGRGTDDDGIDSSLLRGILMDDDWILTTGASSRMGALESRCSKVLNRTLWRGTTSRCVVLRTSTGYTDPGSYDRLFLRYDCRRLGDLGEYRNACAASSYACLCFSGVVRTAE